MQQYCSCFKAILNKFRLAWALPIPLIQLRAPGCHTTDTTTEAIMKYPPLPSGTTIWSQVPQKIHLWVKTSFCIPCASHVDYDPWTKDHYFLIDTCLLKKLLLLSHSKHSIEWNVCACFSLCQWILSAYYLLLKLRFMFIIIFIKKFNKFKFL